MSERPSTSPPAEEGGLFSGFFGRLFGSAGPAEEESNIVEDVIEEYTGTEAVDEINSVYRKCLRADNLILYTIREGATCSEDYPRYNIILHPRDATVLVPGTMYSLYRSESEAEATRIFRIYAQIFPELSRATTTNKAMDIAVLKAVIKVSKQNESYTGVHIAAVLVMLEQLKSRELRGKLFRPLGKVLHTPLHVACIHAKLESLQTILEVDARRMLDHLKKRDFEGNTICHLAVLCKEKAVGLSILRWIKRKVLERGGANGPKLLWHVLAMRNAKGNAPIHLACLNQNGEALEVLSSSEVSKNPNKPTVAMPPTPHLLNIQSAKGSTALHLVVTYPGILQRLLGYGADPNIADMDGLTPLHKAVVMREMRSSVLLLQNKANPNAQGTSARYLNVTPLHLASGICDRSYMKILLEAGANTELTDGNGRTPRNLVETTFEGDPTLKRQALALLPVPDKTKRGGSKIMSFIQRVTGNPAVM